MAITIPRTPLVDDDGSGTTGTILNNAWQTALYNAIDTALAQVPDAGAAGPHTILSATHTDTVPGALVAGDVLVVNAAGALTRLPKGPNGSVLTLASGLPVWAPGAAPGAWVQVPYAAGDYTASASMIWTVEAADHVAKSYTLDGTVMLFCVDLELTTTSGTASYELRVALPAGYKMGGITSGPFVFVVAGVALIGFYYAVTNNTYIALRKFDTSNLTLGANTTSLRLAAILNVVPSSTADAPAPPPWLNDPRLPRE